MRNEDGKPPKNERHPGQFDLSEYELFQHNLIRRSVLDSGLREMMEYSLFAGGKRFRPSLLIRSFLEMSRRNRGEVDATSYEIAMRFAVGIECIHTYSLIHDDLPCMDNDDFRRGIPTSHVKYGEAEALLAGDALLNLGFEIMSEAAFLSDGRAAIRALHYIGRCTGANGMVLGQFFDIGNSGDISEKELERINLYKTSALIRASIVSGVILGFGDEYQIRIAERLGDDIGMIFQLTDDLLDIHSSIEESGKSVGSDEQLHKKTYPALLGEGHVKRMISDLVSRTEVAAEEIGMVFIGDIVRKLVNRRQ